MSAEWMLRIDVGISLAVLTWVFVERARGRLGDDTWILYWSGVAIGMVWELAFYLSGPRYSSDPAYQLFAPFPIHPHLQPVLHSVWDGALFMIGLWLVRKVCRPPHLLRFRIQELFVMLLWGQAQELAVELLATSSGAWSFTPRSYNPVLFEHGIGQITLIPQLIWLVAPCVFYGAALRVRSLRVGAAD